MKDIKKKPVILYVDDEPENLTNFKFAFRKHYTVLLADSAKKGAEILAKEPVQVVLSDQRMPETTGVEFLESLASKYPHIIRIIITAYADIDAVIGAINRGKVYRYVKKPWDMEELKQTLDKALETYALQQENKRLVEELKEANENLEEKVRQRTRTIEEQKQALEEQSLMLQKYAKQQEQFLADTSHEIRTPMNAILGFTKLLLKGELTDKQKQYIQNIETSAENLLVIVNDILDLSQIEHGKLNIERIPFDLKDSIQKAFNTMTEKASQKAIDFQIHLDDKLPKVVMGDPVRLNQIIINLLGNALKFTEKGKVELIVKRCKSKEETPDLSAILLQIKDTGIGISKEKQDRIFDKFTQSDADIFRRFGGSGLGLAITKKLVNLLKGAISVDSEIGKGTTFSLMFQFEEVDKLRLLKRQSKAKEVSHEELRGLHVLVVDDNQLNKVMAVEMLKSLNLPMKIETAHNGSHAIELIGEKNYDIVLMDLRMPDISGMEATKFIRQELPEPFKSVPIIACTANASKSEEKKCLEMGMNDYLSKPFMPEQLFEKISTLIHRRVAA